MWMTIPFSSEDISFLLGDQKLRKLGKLYFSANRFLAHFYSSWVILWIPGSKLNFTKAPLFWKNICIQYLFSFIISILPFIHIVSFFSLSPIPIVSPALCYSFQVWVSFFCLLFCFLFLLQIEFCHIQFYFNSFRCVFYFSHWIFVSFLLTLSFSYCQFFVILYTYFMHYHLYLRGQVLLYATEGIKSLFFFLFRHLW